MFRAIAVIAVVMIHTTPYRQLGKHIQLFWNDACMGWFTFHYLGLILGNKIIDRQFNIRNPAVLYCVSLLLQMAEGYLWFAADSSAQSETIRLSPIR